MYSNKIVLHFPSNLVDKSIIYKLSKDYDLEFNILKAFVNPKEEGLMVLELKGDKKEYDKAIRYLKKEKVRVQTLSKDVVRSEEKCVHCGLCVSICPTQAFEVEPRTRKIKFIQERCIACGICVDSCPYKALSISF
ncbi:MAG: 4Fe-4S dicluster domain-containing protein [Candidatus Omnitrophica bacterium]|nr:4Fe-4S dicluster domain-containing protein [Candidatus Omnitrophota bacterium]MBD3268919.1 4Fe-4S dicluster domain-containing protein [Candidatus Omnitrophota bacterium]